jgi:hypothetical protein
MELEPTAISVAALPPGVLPSEKLWKWQQEVQVSQPSTSPQVIMRPHCWSCALSLWKCNVAITWNFESYSLGTVCKKTKTNNKREQRGNFK